MIPNFFFAQTSESFSTPLYTSPCSAVGLGGQYESMIELNPTSGNRTQPVRRSEITRLVDRVNREQQVLTTRRLSLAPSCSDGGESVFLPIDEEKVEK